MQLTGLSDLSKLHVFQDGLKHLDEARTWYLENREGRLDAIYARKTDYDIGTAIPAYQEELGRLEHFIEQIKNLKDVSEQFKASQDIQQSLPDETSNKLRTICNRADEVCKLYNIEEKEAKAQKLSKELDALGGLDCEASPESIALTQQAKQLMKIQDQLRLGVDELQNTYSQFNPDTLATTQLRIAEHEQKLKRLSSPPASTPTPGSNTVTPPTLDSITPATRPCLKNWFQR
jgi:hypothetical protein